MTKLFPGSFERLNSLSSLTISNIDKTSSESTAVRVLIWQQSLDIISDHWMFGAGVGDANDQLYKAYEENGLSGALQHHLNAHNQYLQTFIGMGLVGVLMLIILSLGGVVRAVLNKNFLLLMFAFLTSLNFLAESMLQTSAGILFFTFFYGIFTQFNEVELIRE